MEKLLIIKPSSLGDIVHGLQVATTIKHYQPDIQIYWVVREIFAPIVEACDAVDAVFIFERNGGVIGFFKLVRELRRQKFDWVFDMQGLARSGLLTFLTRAWCRVGRSDAREGAQWLYQRKVPLPEKGVEAHALEILLQFLPELDRLPKLKGEVTFSGIEPSAGIPKELLAKRPILLFPNSRRPEKEWPYFVKLTDALLKAYPNETFVWLGQGRLVASPEWPKNHFYNLMGQTTLTDVLVLLKQARCAISNDSGPMHMAAAMGVEVLCLFGPTASNRYGPFPLDKETHHVLCAPQGDLRKLEVLTVLSALSFLEVVDTV